MESLREAYANRRMAALAALGFASGMPFLLTSDALQAWMKEAGVDLGSIGLFGLVAVPYSLKVLWAPLMDRYVPPLLGRRRGWLVLTQAALIAGIVAMALTGPAGSLTLFAWIALAVAFASASQDIVADAYRTDILPPAERGAGAATFVTGYRVAMIAGSAGAFILADRLGTWPPVYFAAAAAMGIGIAGAIFAPEPAFVSAPQTLRDAVVLPFREFARRPGGLFVLLFIVLFRLPDTVAGKMTIPFMLDIGCSKTEIGTIRQGLGIAVTIVGTLVGGGVVARWGLIRSLWLFGVLQAASNLGFFVLAGTGPSWGVLVGVIAVENFCGGLVTAGFVAFLMAQCDARFSATQYALLSSVMALGRDVVGAPVGYLAAALGWPLFFAASVAAALPGMALLPWIRLRPGDEAAEG